MKGIKQHYKTRQKDLIWQSLNQINGKRDQSQINKIKHKMKMVQ